MSRVVACDARSICIAVVLAALPWPAQVDAAGIDPAQSEVGFSLRTRWGQTLEGRFPVYEGDILVIGDGRHRVRLVLAAREVEIVGHRKYTRMTRGKGFFDAQRYPDVVFVSEPYGPDLLRNGGALAGVLSIRGVRRREVFAVEPSACARPALDCAVVARGTVRRSDYGVDRWSFALGEDVRFSLRIRISGAAGPSDAPADDDNHDDGSADDGRRGGGDP